MMRNAVVLFADSYGPSMIAIVSAWLMIASVPHRLAAGGQQVHEDVDAGDGRTARALAVVDPALAQGEVVEHHLDLGVDRPLHQGERAPLAHAEDAVLDEEEDDVVTASGQ